jgi:predicted phosphodiesterase
MALAGKRLVMGHGHESYFMRVRDVEKGVAAPSGAVCDYLFHGHTHVARDDRFGPTRVINPGALHRAGTYTVATLDLATDTLTHWIVPDDAAADGPPTRFVLP